jgi:hypothetical protein
MRPVLMRLRLFACLLVWLVPLHAAEGDPLGDARTAIDACTKRLDPAVDIGYDRIAARCPDLARALEQSGFEQWLPEGWKEARNNLSAGSLIELSSVVERELATRATSRTPNVETLDQVLAGLGNQREAGAGVWSKFRRWVRNLMNESDVNANEGWFDRMASRVGVSDAVVEVITYLSIGVLVVLALVVVLNELKAAGLIARWGKSDDVDEAARGEAPARPLPTFGEIERAPLIERPRLLLELISAKLTALRRLPPAGAFTARELARSANLADPQDRERLTHVALVAERARYSAHGVPEDALESAYTQGQQLLKSVDSLRMPESIAVSGA